MAMEQPECSKRECEIWQETGNFIPHTNDPRDEGTIAVCAAFPKGIPEDIAWGNNPHAKPVKGDNGIQYKKATSEPSS
jgi:hypothetical protein